MWINKAVLQGFGLSTINKDTAVFRDLVDRYEYDTLLEIFENGDEEKGDQLPGKL